MSSENFSELEMELGELLQEFHCVMEEFRVPSQSNPHVYEDHLKQAKQRNEMSDGVSDSGIEDSDYSRDQSLGSSLNTSEEELNTAGMTMAPKAKLGDTGDLQSFIESLDRELAEM
ncbi:regulator of cell cycle RGCC-like isoform X2 [Megalops cyprinoides]|uniref:regulator of cell cycle RGCC-like isoform X2 n=1 Tax=Megalops cyprinoides TaxID=118141 RepID=UPI001863BF50|nr:regulator of cell cycle RGCC-like isoform X2 [Megalops cyprinoides]